MARQPNYSDPALWLDFQENVLDKKKYIFFQPTDWIERTKKGNKNEIDPAHPTRM